MRDVYDDRDLPDDLRVRLRRLGEGDADAAGVPIELVERWAGLARRLGLAHVDLSRALVGLGAQPADPSHGHLGTVPPHHGFPTTHASRKQIGLLRTATHRMKVAALGVTLAVGGFWLWGKQSRQTALAPTRTYYTAAAQRTTVRLTDGSTMILAPGTTATVGAQGIDVVGEAYFDVVSHAGHPFVVRTTNAVIRVLGTRFSVRQYPREQNSRIVVDEGRVALRSARAHASDDAQPVATARMLAMVTDSGVTVTSGISTRDYTSWTRGILIFSGVPLRDVVPELERAYGVEIRIADTTLSRRVIGIEVSVSKDRVSDILESLCSVLGAHYSWNGHAYVLSAGRQATKSPSVAPLHHSIPQPEQQYGR